MTRAYRHKASTKATPMNIVVRSIPAASGWRAMPSMAFPTSIPMPIPVPRAPRPMLSPPPSFARPGTNCPRPTASMRILLLSKLRLTSHSRGLMFRVHSQTDIDRGQDGEDKGLQDGNEDFKGHHYDRHHHRGRRNEDFDDRPL